MKDSYSFDRDREGLDLSYEKHAVAYDRIFDRCGLEWYRVESDVGMMGGFGADEYMAPCAAGENEVALAPGYAANVEVASAEAQRVELPAASAAGPAAVETPGLTTVDQVAGALGVPGGGAAEGVSDRPGGRRDEDGRRPRRPPRQRDQAAQSARHRLPSGTSRRDRRAGSARPASSARSGARSRFCSTTESPSTAAATWPGPIDPTSICRALCPDATSSSSAGTSERSSRVISSMATRSGSSRRSRSATSSSSALATRCRWGRPTSTRTGSSS